MGFPEHCSSHRARPGQVSATTGTSTFLKNLSFPNRDGCLAFIHHLAVDSAELDWNYRFLAITAGAPVNQPVRQRVRETSDGRSPRPAGTSQWICQPVPESFPLKDVKEKMGGTSSQCKRQTFYSVYSLLRTLMTPKNSVISSQKWQIWSVLRTTFELKSCNDLALSPFCEIKVQFKK